MDRSNQLEIDLLVRRADRLRNKSSSEKRVMNQEPSPDEMVIHFRSLGYGYDSWESIAKDALKELEKYR